MSKRITTSLLLLFGFNAFCSESLVSSVSIKGVTIKTYETSSGRKFRSHLSFTSDKDINRVTEFLLNFEEKCNNKYAFKRKMISKDKKCLF